MQAVENTFGALEQGLSQVLATQFCTSEIQTECEGSSQGTTAENVQGKSTDFFSSQGGIVLSRTQALLWATAYLNCVFTEIVHHVKLGREDDFYTKALSDK